MMVLYIRLLLFLGCFSVVVGATAIDQDVLVVQQSQQDENAQRAALQPRQEQKKRWRKWLVRGGVAASGFALAYALWRLHNKGYVPFQASEGVPVSPIFADELDAEPQLLKDGERPVLVPADPPALPKHQSPESKSRALPNRLLLKHNPSVAPPEQSQSTIEDDEEEVSDVVPVSASVPVVVDAVPVLNAHAPLLQNNDLLLEKAAEAGARCLSLCTDLMPDPLAKEIDLGYIPGLPVLPALIEISNETLECDVCGEHKSDGMYRFGCQNCLCREDCKKSVIVDLYRARRAIKKRCPSSCHLCHSRNCQMSLVFATSEDGQRFFKDYQDKAAQIKNHLANFKSQLYDDFRGHYLFFMKHQLGSWARYFDPTSFALIYPDFVLNSVLLYKKIGQKNAQDAFNNIFYNAGVVVLNSLNTILNVLSLGNEVTGLNADDTQFFKEKRECQVNLVALALERVNNLMAKAIGSEHFEVKALGTYPLIGHFSTLGQTCTDVRIYLSHHYLLKDVDLAQVLSALKREVGELFDDLRTQ